LAVPVYTDLHDKVAEQKNLVFRHMIQVLRAKYDALQRSKPIEPLHRIEELRQSLLYFEKMLTQQMQHLLRLRMETLKQLQPVDPLHAIEKSEQHCAQLGKQVLRLTEQLLRLKNEKLRSLKPSAPMQRFELYEKRLQQLFVQLEPLVHIQLQRQEELLKKEAAALNALSPLAILSRGYAIAFRDGKAVLDASSLKQGDRLDLRLHKGVAQVRVDHGTKRRSSKRKDVQAEDAGSKNPIQPGLFD
ncbi:MAG: exodeoxyribonuclease VII large subunit, partial [Myxococcota bacterium]|nr:exodeoxyribonuclease VII large subunit [Myxococcota bacterium]